LDDELDRYRKGLLDDNENLKGDMRGRRTGGGRFRVRGGIIFREINKKKYSLQFKLID